MADHDSTSQPDPMEELEALFGDDHSMDNTEDVVLTQDLTGFASCFPDWDLHPPVKR